MLRQIYITSAYQTIISDANPQGIYQKVTGFPIQRDSRDYGRTEENPNGNPEIALIVAQADYADEVMALTTANNSNRVAWCVTLERADGVQLQRKSFGAFPDMTPPEPEHEPETQDE